MLFPVLLSAQSFSSEVLRNQGRNLQLVSGFQHGWSYALNPNRVSLDAFDSLVGITKPLSVSSGFVKAGFLPVSAVQQYNTRLPYEWNDGAMIPAKGYQSLLSAGGYAQLGKHISVQLMPEFVYAANPPFEQLSQQLGTRAWANYYRFLNTSDIPSGFGEKTYQKIFLGQSHIKYRFRSFEAGVSTENMWWGPGWRNALVMGTNAPGFGHLTFNTIRPVKTGIGTFEGQVIAGRLEESGMLPPRLFSIDTAGNFLYQPKRNEWRYITGMTLSWQPKWLPNLYLGFAKTSYLYHSDISSILDVLPLQGFFGRVRTKTERERKKASMGSLFARYVLPSEHAEVYIELGRKDISLMPWNVIQTEDYRRAYVAGLRKLFPTRNQAYIQLVAEFTQMQAPTAELIRDPDSWYTDRYVRQGYTQMGQVIGAGIGPGSNSQTMEISWVKGLKRIGLQLERVRYNSDYYYYAFEYTQDFRRHWIDLSATCKADWNFGPLYVSAQLGIIRSYNYRWLIIQVNPNDFFVPGNEVLNLSGKLGLSYRF
ncbi:capsule assembly Wzi family protein [Sediminibacterium soli]|uniref:capsule assembly Wzi family protein n=1 Tax=Sediminibacterium soli TaxID=2698829 RepID=UPI00137B569A|nr:capsule assembly Wzi family protein [Sediminibacterium soli]NCI48060.1 capsule assembly Wzi family protein [Sediminibacterium soli]